MLLSDEEIRLEPADQFRVDVIKRLSGLEAAPHFGVDFAAGDFNIKRRPCADRQLTHPFRVIALMRPTSQIRAGTETANDFGPAREQ